jgi:hypothetical protein
MVSDKCLMLRKLKNVSMTKIQTTVPKVHKILLICDTHGKLENIMLK